MAATTDGRYLISEAWHLARSRRAAKDLEGTIAACAQVIAPRVFRWSWATTVGPCLLWTGQAQASLGKWELAKASLNRLIAMRSASPEDDPWVMDAIAQLALLK